MDYPLNDTNYDNIRPPDEVKKDQLIQDTRSDYDKQIDEALYLSLQESIHQEQINIQYEKGILTEYENLTIERREIFAAFLLDLNKLIKFDKNVKEVYEIIEPIIECYCGQYIQTCELDEETYDKIFKVVSSIRTNKKNIDNLKTIITKTL